MNNAMQLSMNVADQAAPAKAGFTPQTDVLTNEAANGADFRAALERHMNAGVQKAEPVKEVNMDKLSLGDKIISRVSDLSSQVKTDQEHVSKMLEQAARNGDSMSLVKAMMALHDYQMRVQFISKAANKASSAVERLTTLN